MGPVACASEIDKTRIDVLAERAAEARNIVFAATGTDRLRQDVTAAYHRLESEYGTNVAVAVRSSATAEDLPTASFAGQHESFLNVRGARNLFEACRRCFASIFTDRAIAYRIDNGFDHFKVALSVGIMKMVRADRASSGVIFNLDTESGFRDVVFITGVYGLGENIVQGTVDPDDDLTAMIAAAPEFGGPGFLVPTRNYELLSWCLGNRLRLVYQMTLMTIGLYNEPAGVWLPSEIY